MAVHGSPKIARADFGRSSRAAPLPASAYEEVASALRQKILSGEIDEGDRLPTEVTLAQELRISRSTVREALRVLQAWGFARRVSPRVLIASRSTGEAAQRETHIALMERKATHNEVYET